MSENTRTIVLITTGRADWGILSHLAHKLNDRSDVRLIIGAGNMHVSHRYGHTVDEIRAEGFTDVAELPGPEVDGSVGSRTAVAAALATETAALLEREKADAVILLGDRYEMIGAATAALIAGVPITHLHGGEISEGAIDGAIRHAISKMATLHLTSTRLSAERLMAMGEEPERIVVTGSLGVENTMSVKLLSAEELRARLDGFDIDPHHTLLITFHPVTNHPSGLPTKTQIDNLLEALRDVPGWNAVITYPNNDTDSDIILDALRRFAEANPGRVLLRQSLGKQCYLSAMHNVKAVVGNTSSGIIEAPSTPAYTVDIGPRQQGRERASDIIHVDDDPKAIADAIRKVLAFPRRENRPESNPYFKADASQTAVNAIIDRLPAVSLTKKFYWPNKS